MRASRILNLGAFFLLEVPGANFEFLREWTNVLAADAETRLSKLAQLTNSGVSPPDVNGFLSNACALQVGMHRLLIQPGPASGDSEIPYRLFSCVLTQAPTCGVESNP